MAIEVSGAGAWPPAWQEIGAVPYQLIITMPQYTWWYVAQLAGIFIATAVFVAFATRKKVGFGWSTCSGIALASFVCLPMLLSIDFGPKQFGPYPPLVPLKLSYMTAEADERLMKAMCEADIFPSDMQAACAARNPDQKCLTVDRFSSTCKAAN